LGQDATLGDRVYDVMGQFRTVLGPADYAMYKRFLPDGEDLAMLKSLVKFFVIDPLDFELELKLEGPEVPPLKLDPGEPPRLGWTTWLISGPSPDVSVTFSMS
jgi:type VI secretion system protein ImpH